MTETPKEFIKIGVFDYDNGNLDAIVGNLDKSIYEKVLSFNFTNPVEKTAHDFDENFSRLSDLFFNDKGIMLISDGIRVQLTPTEKEQLVKIIEEGRQ